MSKSKGDWENFDVIKFKADDEDSWANFNQAAQPVPFHLAGQDSIDLGDSNPWRETDMVNSPAHYTQGRFEAIDVIEDAIEEAPSVKAGMLQAQALKYLLRLWHKIDAKEDAEKARWYLNRLIDTLN